MSVIPIDKFWRLRLRKLLPRKNIDSTWDFEYLGRLWLGDTYGFSHALRPYSSPFKTKSIAIDMQDASDKDLLHLSDLLGIEVERSLSTEECMGRHGTPIHISEFTDDRRTYHFVAAGGYEIGFTILNSGGLVFFTMDSGDVAYHAEVQNGRRV